MAHVFLFPGQGSQHVGMGKFLYEEFKIARDLFEEASDAISVDLKKLCFDSDEATLALTENTQPALVTVSVATFAVLNSIIELKPTAVAGHSVGEYAALVAAQTLTVRDAIRLVRLRGQFMQTAVPLGVGGMVAAMGMTPEEADQLCAWTEENSGASPLEPANYNSRDQIVLSGSLAAIDWLKKEFTPEKLGWQKKVRLIPLKVSAPFHCSMMLPAEEKMNLELQSTTFKNAAIPVVQNFTAQMHQDAIELRENLTRQISGSVRWLQSMELLLNARAQSFIECGCGKVLTGLLKKIDTSNVPSFNVNSLEDIRILEQKN
jgi:[acyl-carrier-protein] S-malonyltransferase